MITLPLTLPLDSFPPRKIEVADFAIGIAEGRANRITTVVIQLLSAAEVDAIEAWIAIRRQLAQAEDAA